MLLTIASKRIKNLGINLTKKWKIYILKTTRLWWNKFKETQVNGKIPCVHSSEEVRWLKCPFYPKISIYSVQSLLKLQGYFSSGYKKKKILKCKYAKRVKSFEDLGSKYDLIRGGSESKRGLLLMRKILAWNNLKELFKRTEKISEINWFTYTFPQKSK